MGWYKTGFESASTAFDYDDSQHGPRRFWMPPDSERLIMFMDDNPITFWEHGFKLNGTWTQEACKVRNKLENSCFLCSRFPDRYPSFVGIFTVINMSPWESKKGREGCFKRELLVAKLGSKDKPGKLKKLERFKKEHGRLRGLIFKAYRSGGKAESIGDEHTMIEMIQPDEIAKYGKAKLAEWAKHVNEKISDPQNHVTIEKLWERDPWEPFDYDKVLSIRSNEELRVLIGDAKDSDEGGGSSSQVSDEDVPY